MYTSLCYILFKLRLQNVFTNEKFLSVLWIFSYRKWIKTEMVSWPLKSSLRPARRWLSNPLLHDSYSVVQKQFCTTGQGSVMSLVNQTMTKITLVHTYAVKHHSCFWEMLHFPITFLNYFLNLPLLLFSSSVFHHLLFTWSMCHFQTNLLPLLTPDIHAVTLMLLSD